MEILFDKNHPKSLVEAIRLIQNMDLEEEHTVMFYDTSTKDNELKNPVLLKVDRHRRGIEPATEILYENGFRVFALKFPNQDPDLFELALMVIELWPKMIWHAKNNSNPFIYKCNLQSGRLLPFSSAVTTPENSPEFVNTATK